MTQDLTHQLISWWPQEINDPLLYSLTLCLISWYTWVMIKRSRKRSPPLPPGPRGLPLIGNLPFLEPDLHRYFVKLAQTYGPIIKVQLGSKLCVVLSSSSLAKEVLRDHDTIFANHYVPTAMSELTYGGIEIVFSPYGPNWWKLRKLCAREMMSSKVLDSYYGLRRLEVRQMVRDVRTLAGTTVNIGEIAFQVALNVVMNMIWGGTLDGEGRRKVGLEFQRVINEAIELVSEPNLSDFFPILSRFDVQGVVGRMKKLTSWMDKIFESVLDQRLKIDRGEGGNENKDFLQLLLQLLLQLKEEGDTKTPLTLTKIKAIFVDLVIAGTDTTSTTIEWAMAEMLHYPEKMGKVKEELEQVVGMDQMVEESHVPKLRYLDAVIKETLRLHPPLVFLVPRYPSQTCTVGGYTVPKGTQIVINTWAIHRDPEAWYNPLVFWPERFYNSTSKWHYNGNDFRYLPFGSGRRICVGIPLAERMLTYELASLLHSFDWQLPDDASLDLSEKYALITKKATPLIAIPTPRLPNPELYT